jgi:hypothetical protein
MTNRPPSNVDPEVLPQPVAARLLERASELDADHRSGSAVDDLRAAAAEAGISARAFDTALAELQANQSAPEQVVKRRSRRRGRLLAVGAAIAAVLIGVASLWIVRRAAPIAEGTTGGPFVEESIVLRCLSAAEAAELIRPLLRLDQNIRVISSPRAPRILNVRATAAQLQSVKAALDKYEGTGSPTCAAAPTRR